MIYKHTVRLVIPMFKSQGWHFQLLPSDIINHTEASLANLSVRNKHSECYN